MSSPGLVTLEKSNPQFMKYIWGTFSETEVALPLRSVNVNTDQEQVTFEVIPRVDVGVFSLLISSIKLKNIYLSLVPIFLVLIKNAVDDTLSDDLLAMLSMGAVVFLQLGMELMSDVQDHVRGLDRLHPRSGNKAIQKGWITALGLQRLSWILIGVGVGLGIPSLVIFPEIFGLLAPLLALGFWGALSHSMGFKYRTWSEWVVFLMFGPLLTTAYQFSFGGGFDFEVLALGTLSGWYAVFQAHLKNFDHLLVNAQAGFKNTVVKLGFEKSKKMIVIWWMLFVIGIVIYHAVFSSEFWLWVVSILLVGISWPLMSGFSQLEASVGSKIHKTVLQAQKVSQFAVGLLVLEGLWTYFNVAGLL